MPEFISTRITEAHTDGERNAVATSVASDGRIGVWTDTGEPAHLSRREAIHHIADMAAALLDVERDR
jgi:hypothetical protein